MHCCFELQYKEHQAELAVWKSFCYFPENGYLNNMLSQVMVLVYYYIWLWTTYCLKFYWNTSSGNWYSSALNVIASNIISYVNETAILLGVWLDAVLPLPVLFVASIVGSTVFPWAIFWLDPKLQGRLRTICIKLLLTLCWESWEWDLNASLFLHTTLVFGKIYLMLILCYLSFCFSSGTSHLY